MGIFSKVTGALEASLGLAKNEQLKQPQSKESQPQPQSKENQLANLFLHPPSRFVSLAEMGLKPADARKAKDIHWQLVEQKVRQSFPESSDEILQQIKDTDEIKTIEAWANTPIPNYDALFNNLQLATPDTLIKKVTASMAAQEAQKQQKEIAELRDRLAGKKPKPRPTITVGELQDAREFMQTVGQGQEVYEKQGAVTSGWTDKEPIAEHVAASESTVGEGEFERASRQSETAVENTERGGVFDLRELMKQDEKLKNKSN